MTDETVKPQPDSISCETFEDLASPMLDGEVEGATLGALEAHRVSCAECATFLSDLASIQREAGSLPVLSPPPELWSAIAERIAVPVAPLTAVQPGGGSPARRQGRGPLWPSFRNPWMVAAAAVLLVAVSAGVTYRLVAPDAGSVAPAGTLATGTVPAIGQPAPSTPAAADSAAASGTPRSQPAGGATPAPGSTARLAANQSRRAGVPDVAGAYAPEIDRMRILLDERRANLDTGTVRVLETNLQIIDRAIQESRDALARDPASGLLNRQLSDALGQKLELMRTAVQLTSGA